MYNKKSDVYEKHRLVLKGQWKPENKNHRKAGKQKRNRENRTKTKKENWKETKKTERKIKIEHKNLQKTIAKADNLATVLDRPWTLAMGFGYVL